MKNEKCVTNVWLRVDAGNVSVIGSGSQIEQEFLLVYAVGAYLEGVDGSRKTKGELLDYFRHLLDEYYNDYASCV